MGSRFGLSRSSKSDKNLSVTWSGLTVNKSLLSPNWRIQPNHVLPSTIQPFRLDTSGMFTAVLVTTLVAQLRGLLPEKDGKSGFLFAVNRPLIFHSFATLSLLSRKLKTNTHLRILGGLCWNVHSSEGGGACGNHAASHTSVVST